MRGETASVRRHGTAGGPSAPTPVAAGRAARFLLQQVRGRDGMSAATSIPPGANADAEAPGTARTLPANDCAEITLLDLVRAVSEECTSDAEVVATVLHLLASGRARLCGNFRHASLRDLCGS